MARQAHARVVTDRMPRNPDSYDSKMNLSTWRLPRGPGLFHLGFVAFLLALGPTSWALEKEGVPRVEKKSGKLREQHGLLTFDHKPFTGIEIERYQNGELYKENQFKNGLQEGSSKEYALGGILRAQWQFSHGKKNGLQQGWFVEGSKRFEYHFKNGLLDGLQTEWHQNGNLFRSQAFHRGVETDKKIFYQDKGIFTNYSKREGRTYGIDGGALCLESKKEGEK